MSKNQNIPRPFVVKPPLATQTRDLPGEPLRFEFVAVGEAINYLPYFIVAFRELAEGGFGLNRTWRPQLAITGAGGLPALERSGNVLCPATSVKVSPRLPPTVDANTTTSALKQLFEKDPPYGAKVTFESEQCAFGWNAPPLEPRLENALKSTSLEFFGKEACYIGEGGTIPFMAMLGERFPRAQFMITGVLGPRSNAHGPNEFLDIQTGMRLTGSVARVLAEHFREKQR